jgi:ribosomal protein S27AE
MRGLLGDESEGVMGIIEKLHRFFRPVDYMSLAQAEWITNVIDHYKLKKKRDINMAEKSCADCGTPIGEDGGPPDGWELEDGRVVCGRCCVKDTVRLAEELRDSSRRV